MTERSRDHEPTATELSEGVRQLVDEVAKRFGSDGWFVLASGTEHSAHRLYSAAALSHCCNLLFEIEQAAAANLELAVRILGRAHIEAWLFGLYVHFGGFPALTRLAEDTQYSLEATHHDFQQFDEWLVAQKRKARRSLRKVQANNARIREWNDAHQDQPAKPLTEEPYVPRMMSTGVDLSQLVTKRSVQVSARRLPLSVVVAALTASAPEKGFGRESFSPIYHVYRLVSAGGPHPTMDLLDSYLDVKGYVRVLGKPDSLSMIMATRVTSLYSTAFLAEWVFGESEDGMTSVSRDLRQWLEPTPEGGRGWVSGSPGR